jgi:acid phosphatase (class A)
MQLENQNMNKLVIIFCSIIYCTTVFSANGFLTKKELPNSYKILPAPPVQPEKYKRNQITTPKFSQDEAISETLHFTSGHSQKRFFNGQKISPERIIEAQNDANKSTDYFLKIFIDPLNISDRDKTKIKNATVDIVTKVVIDAAKSTGKAKEKYHRERPYAFYNKASCTGDDASSKKAYLSYPSGHSIRGITVARVLAKILPKFREQLLARGTRYGDNRVICGAHWQSDIQASRVLSGFVITKLQKNDKYKKDLEQAKRKIGTIKSLQ